MNVLNELKNWMIENNDDDTPLHPSDIYKKIDELVASKPSGGKSAEDVRIAADKWFSATEWIDADKNSFAAGAKWMQEQYAHQQPVQVQLCPKCNGEGKCFEIIIPTEYRVCPVRNGDKILYPPISQQPVIDGWRVYNTGVDITEQCTFESGVITINSNVVHRG